MATLHDIDKGEHHHDSKAPRTCSPLIPAIKSGMALFSAANARSFALKSVERRKQLALKRYEPAAPEPLPAEQGARKVASDTLEEIKTVLGRLNREPGMAPDKLDLLTRSLERLWKIHAHAGGIPLVAPRKEKRGRSGEAIELMPTIELLPEPEQPVMAPNNVNGKVDTNHDITPPLSSSETVTDEPALPVTLPDFDSDPIQDNEPLG
jgi:hypothetical protein